MILWRDERTEYVFILGSILPQDRHVRAIPPSRPIFIFVGFIWVDRSWIQGKRWTHRFNNRRTDKDDENMEEMHGFVCALEISIYNVLSEMIMINL